MSGADEKAGNERAVASRKPAAGSGPAERVGLREVEAAAGRLEGVVVRTPLLPLPDLSERVGAEVRLKCESLQRTGSFKPRGAWSFASRLPVAERERGLITYSSGNHGQAVAYAARRLGVRAVVVMPTTAPPVKRRGVERLGGEVVLEGTTSVERQERAEAMAAREGLAVVPPFDHRDVIAGQGTVGLEIGRQWPEVDVVLVPVGGGGLLAGTAAVLRGLAPGTTIVGVEPEGAAAMSAALERGRPVTLGEPDTIADGLAPVRVGDLTFAHVRDLVDEVVRVPDERIREAAAFLLERGRLVVEYSGAATVAALLHGALDPAGLRVAAVVSGGNADPAILRDLLESGAGG